MRRLDQNIAGRHCQSVERCVPTSSLLGRERFHTPTSFFSHVKLVYPHACCHGCERLSTICALMLDQQTGKYHPLDKRRYPFSTLIHVEESKHIFINVFLCQTLFLQEGDGSCSKVTTRQLELWWTHMGDTLCHSF